MGAQSCPEHRARFTKNQKLLSAPWRIHRCQKLVRASWEDSEIDPDRPHGPEFESERVGDGHVEEHGGADW